MLGMQPKKRAATQTAKRGLELIAFHPRRTGLQIAIWRGLVSLNGPAKVDR